MVKRCFPILCSTIFLYSSLQAMDSLHEAARTGSIEQISALLTSGNLNARGSYNRTPLHVAAMHGRLDAVQLLLRAGADVNARDNNGWTPLYLAIEYRHKEITKELLTSGAHVFIQDRFGKSPLLFAFWSRELYKIIETDMAYKAMVTLLSSLHSRLGAQSPARVLPHDILRWIFELLTQAVRC